MRITTYLIIAILGLAAFAGGAGLHAFARGSRGSVGFFATGQPGFILAGRPSGGIRPSDALSGKKPGQEKPAPKEQSGSGKDTGEGKPSDTGQPGAPSEGSGTPPVPGKLPVSPEVEPIVNEDEDRDVPDLIKQAGFDMIYPNFNKETGRRDPFVPVPITTTDWNPIKKLAGESFRVIGTAMTPSGQIAMISVMDQTKVVREGDILENGSAVASISPYEVVIEKDGREMRLTMFTRRRIAKDEGDQGASQLKIKELSNINDLYKKYLDEKFGEEYAGKEGEAERPGGFNEYMEESRKQSGGQEGQEGGEESDNSSNRINLR